MFSAPPPAQKPLLHEHDDHAEHGEEDHVDEDDDDDDEEAMPTLDMQASDDEGSN